MLWFLRHLKSSFIYFFDVVDLFQDKIRQVFDNLIQLDHPNIVKFHKYWTDTSNGKSRVSIWNKMQLNFGGLNTLDGWNLC